MAFDRCKECGHDLLAHAKHTKKGYNAKNELVASQVVSFDCAYCECVIKI